MSYKKIAPIQGTKQQDAIWFSLRSGSSHLMVKALAGTGKTFTIVHGIQRVPSSVSVAVIAFNASIAETLQQRVPRHVKACTSHALGNLALKSAGIKAQIRKQRTWEIIDRLLPNAPYRLKGSIAKLASFCKNTLADPRDGEALKDAMFFLDIRYEDSQAVIDPIPAVLDGCKEDTRVIDFDDMIWLPLVLGLSTPKYDLLCVDETQDLNKCQRELALRSGERLCVVGDSYQSIFGFRGADPQSMPNFLTTLEASPLGIEVHPLTLTRRCPQQVTRLARCIVEDFECLEDAPRGSVSVATQQQMRERIEPGDMLLCRTNAPLFSQAYRFLQKKVRVRVQGRDLAEGLKILISKLNQPDVPSLLSALDDWKEQEEVRILDTYKYGVEAKLSLLSDRCDCLHSIAEDLHEVKDLQDRIDYLFRTPTKGEPPTILLSSAHRAKGLENKNVFILDSRLMPHPMAKQQWEKDQERNLAYVAATRSLLNLTFVDEGGVLPEYFASFTALDPLETNHANQSSQSSKALATTPAGAREVRHLRPTQERPKAKGKPLSKVSRQVQRKKATKNRGAATRKAAKASKQKKLF